MPSLLLRPVSLAVVSTGAAGVEGAIRSRITLKALLGKETLPASSTAAAVYEYVASGCAASVESVKKVPGSRSPLIGARFRRSRNRDVALPANEGVSSLVLLSLLEKPLSL